ncbi:MAG TPA: hypothetical protein VEF35_05320 [Candidatus Bathyarchaeia archaeon]|nr:hypothetical protein [Candidatus Bathyarchaeia archaeon]
MEGKAQLEKEELNGLEIEKRNNDLGDEDRSEGTHWFLVTLLSAAFVITLDKPTREVRMISSTLDT